MAARIADPKPGETPGLGQGTHRDRVLVLERDASEVDIREVGVGEVDEQQLAAGSLCHRSQVGLAHREPGGVVGSDDRDYPGARIDLPPYLLYRKGSPHPAVGLERSPGHGSALSDHLETGVGENQIPARLEVGAADPIDCLVRPGGHEQAFGIDAQAPGEQRLQGSGVGVVVHDAAGSREHRLEKRRRRGRSLARMQAHRHRVSARRDAVGLGIGDAGRGNRERHLILLRR